METKKKLLFVITKGNFGGAQRYVFDLATGFCNDFDVSVAIGDKGSLEDKLSKKGIGCFHLEHLKNTADIVENIIAVKEIVALLKKVRPDIIHINSSVAGAVGTLATRIYNIFFAEKESKTKIIFTAHGWAFNEKRPFAYKILFYIVHFFTVLFSDITISVSKKAKNDISQLKAISQKITVINNGIEEIPLLSKNNARLILHKESEFNYWIGTISELHSNKGLDTAIYGISPLLKENPKMAFYIIGSGEKESELKAFVKKLSLESQIIFLGHVDTARQYLKAFDIFTLTSRTEAFPYVLIEAGFARMPVIATDVGGISEIIENLHTGLLIKPNLPNEFRHAITYAMEHKKDMQKFGQNLFDKTTKELSLKNTLEKTREVYEI